MSKSESDEEEELIRLIIEFIAARKSAKLEAAEEDRRKGKLDDTGLEERRVALDAAYEPGAWIEDAARRSPQIRIATHIAKAIHPDSAASSLRAGGAEDDRWTGTPMSSTATDVVGNAAAMDVNGFLSLVLANSTIGERMLADDPVLANVLRTLRVDPVTTKAAFSSTFDSPEPRADQWLKQVYFPIGDDSYHLLAPLYPSSLASDVHNLIREARFGEAAKEARKARREGAFCESGLVEYPNLLLEMFGSGKPQNVSVLTNKRRGEAYHFPSCPPLWHGAVSRPIWGTDTVFRRVYPRTVRHELHSLTAFLKKERGNNVDLRAHRASLVEQLVDRLHSLALSTSSLEAGWSSNDRCELDVAERLWLDPGRVELDEEFATAHEAGGWRREVADRFARWLNKELSRAEIPVGDAEHREWRDEALDAVGADIEPEEEPHDDVR